MKQAVTLLELIVAMIIIGILATMALPIFSKTIEGTRAKAAVAALEQIRTAERIYRVEENTYWRIEAGINNDNGAINQQLRLDLDERAGRDWDYSITATADTFTATAERRAGGYEEKTITIDEDGELGGSWPLPLPGQ